MATLLPFLKNQTAFDPETVRAMSMAFDDVCKELALKLSEIKAREVIAKKIIELARNGERSPTQLRDRALKAVGVTKGSVGDGPEQHPAADEKRYSGM
jgi:hypothetical protein